jgi:hypothetical protein
MTVTGLRKAKTMTGKTNHQFWFRFRLHTTTINFPAGLCPTILSGPKIGPSLEGCPCIRGLYAMSRLTQSGIVAIHVIGTDILIAFAATHDVADRARLLIRILRP